MKLLDWNPSLLGMKTIRCLYLILFSALAVPAASDAQIADNEASVSVLAVQCAVSSGFSASEYEEYCRRLAKTLSLLSSDQQTRVFGYLPMPGAASLGRSEPGVNSTSGSTGSSKEVPDRSNSLPDSGPTSGSNEVGAKETSQTSTPTQSNSLLDMVGRFNSIFDGTASNSNGSTAETPLVSAELGASVGSTTSTATASTDPGTSSVVSTTTSSPLASATTQVTSPTATTSGTSGTQASKTSSGWSSLMAWFEAAEAAYKSGTLSSFLKGAN